jgi:hypothetical protein
MGRAYYRAEFLLAWTGLALWIPILGALAIGVIGGCGFPSAGKRWLLGAIVVGWSGVLLRLAAKTGASFTAYEQRRKRAWDAPSHRGLYGPVHLVEWERGIAAPIAGMLGWILTLYLGPKLPSVWANLLAGACGPA